MTVPVVQVKDLQVRVGAGGPTVVDGLSFSISRGGTLALVGESGSGKTMAARSVLKLLPPALKVTQGSIAFEGQDISCEDDTVMRKLRGDRIGMIFQEPMVSLNPSMRIGEQMAEGLRLHQQYSAAEIRDMSLAMLERIQIKDPKGCLAAYAHEFSGGMRQRIMIASVMLMRPALLIADEPTTALDTLVSRDVLDLMMELTEEQDTAVLLISHDLGMVARYTKDLVVMKDGQAIEHGNPAQVLKSPEHPYTKRLVDALPRRSHGGVRHTPTEPLMQVEGLRVTYPGRPKLLRAAPPKEVLHGVDLTVGVGETLALVGGSGSGKTTLGRALVGLTSPSSGTIRFRGEPLDWRTAPAERRRDIQFVFQDPYSSLNPRQSVGAIVGEPLRREAGSTRASRHDRVSEVLDLVGLSDAFAPRLPHQLSGGQRQRVAIARALVREPGFLVADEPVSALDLTVQAQLLKLIRALQNRLGFACLFVSHDLGAVEQVADRVAVMQDGQIVEEGSRDDIFDRPQHAYTRALLDAAMLIDRQFGKKRAAE